jgi:ATP-dependent exoDNAse (exonuclease V) beta subunit
MGVIDLVVVSKDGKVRIFDFKTSNKNPDAWSHAKDFRIH